MKLRRSMLFVPGNNPSIIKDVHIYKPDAIMFDLEDAIAVTEKDSARFLVYNMINKFRDYYKKFNIETVVRINALDTPYGVEDLEFIVRAQPDVIRLPKTETAQDILDVEAHIARIEAEVGIPVGTTKMMAAIESPLGAFNAREISVATKRLIGIAIGGEDYVTNMKTNRSPEGIELLAARSMIVMAARVAGIAALDTVYSDINNEEGFLREANLIKQMGFDGKSLIHPKQVELVHGVYTPKDIDIKKANKIITATSEAEAAGLGVFTVDGKMVDRPIIERAKHVLALAKAAGVNIGGDN
ncbi:MAG: aldolase/citrate lyase family protein [Fusobacteriaceae bacterium]